MEVFDFVGFMKVSRGDALGFLGADERHCVDTMSTQWRCVRFGAGSRCSKAAPGFDLIRKITRLACVAGADAVTSQNDRLHAGGAVK